ncbi:unnamed protein product [Rhizoctonia solani]|uniref:Uncharacterized protein n=1 Tax=Rhizoctonia solani TaxID=456999 RepID=A0A8H3B1W3_9AGAM|nr:unnamed protein product [Rhizoctonia solani]
MSASVSSHEYAFIGRVDAMESSMMFQRTFEPCAMPINPILAAQWIVNTAEALKQVEKSLARSPLRREVTLSAPKLKRNYGSVDLSKIMSTSSSSGSSVIVTPIDASFPMHRVKWDEDEGEIVEQDVSPASSAPSSPVLEFSIFCNRRRRTVSTHKEPQPFGILFGPSLTPEFVPAHELSDYLEFLDTLEDCDSLGQLADLGAPSLPSSPDPNATELIPSCSYVSICKSNSASTIRQWSLDQSSPSTTEDMSSTDIKLDRADLTAVDSLLASPKHLFEAVSPRIIQGSWGLPGPVFESAFDAQIASPTIGTGLPETLPWIPAIASLALVATVAMGPYWCCL